MLMRCELREEASSIHSQSPESRTLMYIMQMTCTMRYQPVRKNEAPATVPCSWPRREKLIRRKKLSALSSNKGALFLNRVFPFEALTRIPKPIWLRMRWHVHKVYTRVSSGDPARILNAEHLSWEGSTGCSRQWQWRPFKLRIYYLILW